MRVDSYPILKRKMQSTKLEMLAIVWGLEHFRRHKYGKPIELFTDHQAPEPLTEKKRSNKTCSARLAGCLDRLAHFDSSN